MQNDSVMNAEDTRTEGLGSFRKVCYVITDHGLGQYARLTFLSASLLRRLYPDMEILLLCDSPTAVYLQESHRNLLDLVTHCVPVETGLPEARSSSRFIKSAMRQIVSGNFVFIDSDALPIRRFDDICAGNCELAAAPDRDISTWELTPSEFVVKHMRDLGYEGAPPGIYYNSGVLFLADTPAMRKFGELWHSGWHKFRAGQGAYMDQPAFNYAIRVSGARLRTLDGSYNAMISTSVWQGVHARILHFWLNAQALHTQGTNLLAHLYTHLEATGRVDYGAVDRVLANPFAFCRTRSVVMDALGAPGCFPRRHLSALRRAVSRKSQRAS